MPHKLLPLALVAGLAAVTAGCGEFIRQDRAPVTLVMDALEGASGLSTTFGGMLSSDVVTVVDDVPTIYGDVGRVTLRLIMKDVLSAPSPTNSVTINRYRVTYRRSDGRNTPGVDVPFPFDSAVTFTVGSGTPVARSFELVRIIAKEESPLRSLAASPVVISTIAEITFFGRDQAGNETSVTGTMGVQFGNFADPD